MESSLPMELVPNLNRIAHGIELELELMQKNHENPSPDSNPSLELIQPYDLQGSAKRRGLGYVNSLPGSAWL